LLCGLASRLPPSDETLRSCQSIAEVDTLSSIYSPDTDTADLADYTTYTGNARRVITVAVVEDITATGSLVVLGFRQFLLDPHPTLSNINPADPYGRMVGLYIGSVAPLQQGRFDGCQQAAGPGKVVLHQ
jgi:hypothetical protein